MAKNQLNQDYEEAKSDDEIWEDYLNSKEGINALNHLLLDSVIDKESSPEVNKKTKQKP